MRGKQHFYFPETLRQTISAVCGLFSNVVIFRHDHQKEKVKMIKVPVQFGTTSKRHRFENSTEADKYYSQFPRINVKFGGLSFASDRLISPNTERFWSVEEIHFVEDDVDPHSVIREFNSLFKDFNPIPYDYSFSVEVLTTNLEDTSQILENVLPYFTPKNTSLRVKEFKFLNIERDLVLNIGGVDVSVGEDFSEDERRLVTSNFNLDVEGFMYRPVRSDKLVDSILMQYFANTEHDNTFSLTPDEDSDTNNIELIDEE